MKYVPSFVPSGKVIPGFPAYLVFDDGTVFSRYAHRDLKPNRNAGGYLTVELTDGLIRKRVLIHRLVAEAFIPNPENLPQVNHIDENKENNSATNLEWCTAKYNMNYGEAAKTRHKKIDYTRPVYRENAIKNSMKMRKPVQQIKDGCVIADYESSADAARENGMSGNQHIIECCLGKRKTAGGFSWRYKKGE